VRLFRRRSERGTPAADGPAAPPANPVTRATPPTPARAPGPVRVEVSIMVTAAGPYPVCSQCGRSQFPLIGGWDPPICQDCDAAINEDAMWAEEVGS
jgi:hypothetical protein